MKLSLQDFLRTYGNKARNIIEGIKKDEESELKYEENESVDSDFLLMMLSNGYINRDYRLLISKSYDAILTPSEKALLIAIKTGATLPFKTEIKNLSTIELFIEEYQWDSPGVLNNSLVKYILEKSEFNADDDFKKEKILEAIFRNDVDCKNIDFFKQFIVENLNFKDEFIRLLAKRISNPTIKDNALALKVFFEDANKSFFHDFVTYASTHSNETVVSNICKYLNEEKQFFHKYLEEIVVPQKNFGVINNFKDLDLSKEILQIIGRENFVSYYAYKTSRKNLDLVLEFYGKTNESKNYLTKCFEINPGYKENVQAFIENVISDFHDGLDEKFDTIQYLFSNEAHLNPNLLADLFGISKPSWTILSLFMQIANNNLWAQKLKELVASICSGARVFSKDDPDVRWCEKNSRYSFYSVIAESLKDDYSEIKFFESRYLSYLGGRNISLLNVLSNNLDVINALPDSKIICLIRYSTDFEKNLMCLAFCRLIERDFSCFEKHYGLGKLSVDSPLKTYLLKAEYKSPKIKYSLLTNSTELPDDDEDYEIYIRARKTLNDSLSIQDTQIAKKYVQDFDVTNILNILKSLDLQSFKFSLLYPFVNYVDSMENKVIRIADRILNLLFQDLFNNSKKLNVFLSLNTFSYSNGIQGISEYVKTNDQEKRKVIQQFQLRYIALLKSYKRVVDYIIQFESGKNNL